MTPIWTFRISGCTGTTSLPSKQGRRPARPPGPKRKEAKPESLCAFGLRFFIGNKQRRPCGGGVQKRSLCPEKYPPRRNLLFWVDGCCAYVFSSLICGHLPAWEKLGEVRERDPVFSSRQAIFFSSAGFCSRPVWNWPPAFSGRSRSALFSGSTFCHAQQHVLGQHALDAETEARLLICPKEGAYFTF